MWISNIFEHQGLYGNATYQLPQFNGFCRYNIIFFMIFCDRATDIP